MSKLMLYRRALSLLAAVGLLSSLALNGCASSSSMQVDTWYPEQSYKYFQKELAGKDVTVFLGDGTTRVGKALLIDAERVSWQESGATDRDQVATANVWKLEAGAGSNAGSGALKGFLILGGFGAVVGAVSSDSEFFGGPAGSALVVGGLFGIIGAIFGAIVGGASSSTSTYVVNPDLAPAPPEPDTEAEPMDEWFEDL